MDDKSGLNEKYVSQDNMDSTEPPSPSSDNINKEHPIRKTEVEDPQIIHIGTGSESDGSEDATELDPFVPFPEMHIEEGGILTVRAIVVGCLLGGLVNASNTYLGTSFSLLISVVLPLPQCFSSYRSTKLNFLLNYNSSVAGKCKLGKFCGVVMVSDLPQPTSRTRR